jgi:predicted ATP-grasp superfamily ATP-dependent carboligase
MALFTISFQDQKLPGFTNPLDIDVNVHVITITSGNLTTQWSIDLPQSGNRFPGSEPIPSLFANTYSVELPPEIEKELSKMFESQVHSLLENLIKIAESTAEQQ